MDYFFDNPLPLADNDRVDGRAKVTGAADYTAEQNLPGLVYGVLVGSTVANGTVTTIDSKAAERAPGVLAVYTHLNAPKIPGYEQGQNPAKGQTTGGGLRIFQDNVIRFSGQPIALVVADTFERATHAASLVRARYGKETALTSLATAMETGKPVEGEAYKENVRGEKDAWKAAPVKVEGTYTMPIQVHNPMELHATIARWESEDKVTVWEKTQGPV
ncbi:MAG: xanthine dehydrogenase family protein molybdopterin-binding subunit, partial [Chitinophagaceae bacterium]